MDKALGMGWDRHSAIRFRALVVAMAASAGLAAESPPNPSRGQQVIGSCVLDLTHMPPNWRPGASAAKRAQLSQEPWNAAETADSARAVERGLDEMIAFFRGKPWRVLQLGDDAIESFLDVAHAAGQQPALQRRARAQAALMLELCARPWVKRDVKSIRATDFETLITLTIYAHQLLHDDSAVTKALAERCNRALSSAGSLRQATGVNIETLNATQPVDVNRAYDLVMWCITLIEAQTVPDLELRDEARKFALVVWPYVAAYPLKNARDLTAYPTFYNLAYLATHIGYIPTGYGRHGLYVEDAPQLYRFLRENFYSVLGIGELDLLAEFVDLLRQFGCSEDNDLQVRDGTRYLLSLYHSAGESWMAHREPNEHRHSSDYDLLHKPWTGISGVRRRIAEPPSEGTYGNVFRALFPGPTGTLRSQCEGDRRRY